MKARASCRVRMAGRIIGSAIARPDDLWDCCDAGDKVLAFFPNRARAIDALVVRANRLSSRSNIGASIKLEPLIPNGAPEGRHTGDCHAPVLSPTEQERASSSDRSGDLDAPS